MIIALTKKLALAMDVKPAPCVHEENPIFMWTANWTNTFSNRKEETLVLVNHATRFTVVLYGVKKRYFKDITIKIIEAIRNTFLAMNLSSELIDEYFKQAGEIHFSSNSDKKLTAWINHACRESTFWISRTINGTSNKPEYNDIFGHLISRRIASYGGNSTEYFEPAKKLIELLIATTEKNPYNYTAYEILVTLDLELYKATRRLIVPANISFYSLHDLLQEVYNWENYHLYDFSVFEGKKSKPTERLVPFEEDLEYDDEAEMIGKHTLEEYLPKYKKLIYTYDMGDNWEHNIELVRVIENHSCESPYLVEAIGQGAPEDVGGSPGFVDFYKIWHDPSQPDYAHLREWARFWRPELDSYRSKPRVIHV